MNKFFGEGKVSFLVPSICKRGSFPCSCRLHVDGKRRGSGKLGLHGPGGCAAVGAGERRGVRRGPQPSDAVRSERRRGQHRTPHDVAVLTRSLSLHRPQPRTELKEIDILSVHLLQHFCWMFDFAGVVRFRRTKTCVCFSFWCRSLPPGCV